MASCPDRGDASDSDFIKAKEIGKAIGELIKTALKVSKFQTNRNVEPIIEGLIKHVDEIIQTPEGRKLLASTKHLVSSIKNKEAFLGIMRRIFNVAQRIARKSSGKFGLVLMGVGIVIFLTTATGVGKGVPAVWLTYAGQTLTGRLFSSGSTLVRKGAKEVVPNKQALVTLLNMLVYDGREFPLLSREELEQLETMDHTSSTGSFDDWVVL